MIIDFHTHAMPPAVKKDRRPYLVKDPAFASIHIDAKAVIATPADLLDSMDRDGVDISVIVNYSWTTHDFCVETNNNILEAIAKYPKRFAGFCAVNSLVDDASLREIERCAEAGVKGIGELRPDTQDLDYTKKDIIKPFADLARKHKLIVLTHASEPAGHLYAGKGAATPGMLYSLLSQLKDIPVVFAHWGGGLPFYALMPEVREALEDVYFDTSASPLLYRPEIYTQVASLIGADRILFGSDYPVISHKRIINEINASELSAEDKELIISGNARRLLEI